MQHLLGFELLRHKDLNSTFHSAEAVTGQETARIIKRTSQHPRRLLMASLEIREDLFYEYVVIWGRGGEGDPPLVLGIWTPPSWSSSSPWTINNKGSESDVRIGHKLVTPRSRGVTRVTKMASECRRIKVFFLSPANLRLCLYERFIARARFTLYALLCIISWDHGIFTDRNMEYENVWRASIILG